MYSKSPLSGTKKRPHEASGVEGPEKSRPVVDLYGDVFDNVKVCKLYARVNELMEVSSRG